MLHQIPETRLGPHRDEMAHAIQACVHCGFCLPACPTYQELGSEMDSPRGRIILMKEVLEGNLDAKAAEPHLDACLGCLACEPACPSGVPYRDLISPFRAHHEETRKRGPLDLLRRFAVSKTLPDPKRFRQAADIAQFVKPFAKYLPKHFRAMLDLVPSSWPKAKELQTRYPAKGEQRGRVALLTGCAQSVIAPRITLATIEVLTQNGVEVLLPEEQGCCGALAWHVGDLPSAREKARTNIAAFSVKVDAIVTNAAGCGSGMQEYGQILKGTGDEKAAKEFSARVVDVSVYLAKLGLVTKSKMLEPAKIAYQDACHLRNAQGVVDPPRELLRTVENLELVEILDGAQCCGSAGTYNIDQPDIAGELGRKKIAAIVSTAAEGVVSGNIGCITQMKLHAKQEGHGSLRVEHTMELLARTLS